MHREDWDAVYLNQDRILNSLKGLESDIFMAGGTGLHRFVLDKPYRHSEDLDFFFPALRDNEEIIDFSYQRHIKQRAKVFDLDTSSYLELVDVLEENSFWIDEIKRN